MIKKKSKIQKLLVRRPGNRKQNFLIIWLFNPWLAQTFVEKPLDLSSWKVHGHRKIRFGKKCCGKMKNEKMNLANLSVSCKSGWKVKRWKRISNARLTKLRFFTAISSSFIRKTYSWTTYSSWVRYLFKSSWPTGICWPVTKDKMN